MKENKTKPDIRFKGFTDDWEQRKLGEVAEFLDNMRKPLKEGDREKGSYPFYGASGIVDYVSDYIFDEELVLLSEDGANITDRNYPVCFLASGKYWVNNHAHVLKPTRENENNFICNSLEQMDFTPYNSGMAMPKLNKEVCQNIGLYCPTFAEQKKIGDYFRNLDNLITLHQREHDQLKELKKTMLKKMFPRDGSNIPEVRFAGFTDDWEQRKLGDVGTTFTGLSGKTANDFGHGEASFITYMNVFTNPISNPKMVEHVEIDQKQKEVEVGDIFFTTSSETPKEVGMSSVLKEKCGITYLNSFCFGFRPSVKFDLDYLAFMLRSESVRDQIKLLAQGISRFNISKTKMMDIDILIPKTEEQEAIGKYFSQLDNLITLHQRL